MDPRNQSIDDRMKARDANHSPLMRALAKAAQGETVNFCPFGCEEHELDERGYCPHLVGFSNDGKTMEPFVQKGDQRVVVGERPEPVRKGDKLVRITVSSRVYRDVDKEPKETKQPAAV